MNYLFTLAENKQKRAEIKKQFDIANERQTFKIRLVIIFILSYWWNVDTSTTLFDNDSYNNIINSLKNGSDGSYISIISNLDNKLNLNKWSKYKSEKIKNSDEKVICIQDFAKIRNDNAHTGLNKYEYYEEFYSLFKRYIQDNISCTQKIIEITSIKDKHFIGISYVNLEEIEEVKISCEDYDYLQTDKMYFQHISKDGSTKFVPLFPFINYIDSKDLYIFSRLEDPRVGRIKYQNGEGGTSVLDWGGYFNYKDDKVTRGNNGTCINRFENNFKSYHKIGLDHEVQKYLTGEYSKSSVDLTIWGSGGVGKTALIQYICQNFLETEKKQFDYIIFVSAKDRIYTPSGKIEDIDNSVNNFNQILDEINKVINFNLGLDKTILEEFRNYNNGKILLVIDDFETFDLQEQNKIKNFIKTLNSEYHKVVLITRNNPELGSHSISTDELTIDKTKNLLSALLKEKPDSQKISNELKSLNNDDINVIYEITAGRPLFIKRLIDIVTQDNGFTEILKSKRNISSDSTSVEFLYGRYFESITNTISEKIYLTIGKITNKETLSGRLDSLQHILELEDKEKDFKIAVSNLEQLKIIQVDKDSTYKVYATELLNLMRKNYDKYPDNDFKNKVYSRNKFLQKDKTLIHQYYDYAKELLTVKRHSVNELEVAFKKVLDRDNKLDKLDLDEVLAIKLNALEELVEHLYNSLYEKEKAVEFLKDYLKIFEIDKKSFITLLFDLSNYISNSTSMKEIYFNYLIKTFEEYYNNNSYKCNSIQEINLLSLYFKIKSSDLLNKYNDIKNKKTNNEIDNQDWHKIRFKLLNEMEDLYKNLGAKMLENLQDNKFQDLVKNHNINNMLNNLVIGLEFAIIILWHLSDHYKKIALDLCDFAMQILNSPEQISKFNILRGKVNGMYLSNSKSKIDLVFESDSVMLQKKEIIKEQINLFLEQKHSEQIKLKYLFRYFEFLTKNNLKYEIKNYQGKMLSNIVSIESVSIDNIHDLVRWYFLKNVNKNSLTNKPNVIILNFLESYFKITKLDFAERSILKLYLLKIYFNFLPYLDNYSRNEDQIKKNINNIVKPVYIYLLNNKTDLDSIECRLVTYYSLTLLYEVTLPVYADYASEIMKLRNKHCSNINIF